MYITFSFQVFEDLHSYMVSLQKILDLKPSVIYPGHGIVIKKPVELVTYYINHRLERERQILDVLQKQEDKFLTTLEIVSVVYQGLASTLIPAACNNATHHLQKLVKDNKVECRTDAEESQWRFLPSQKSNI